MNSLFVPVHAILYSSHQCCGSALFYLKKVVNNYPVCCLLMILPFLTNVKKNSVNKLNFQDNISNLGLDPDPDLH